MPEDIDPPNDELSLAELAATEGPVFAMWRANQSLVDAALLEMRGHNIRHMMSPDRELIVHRNDAEVARTIVTATCGPDLELANSQALPTDREAAVLVTVYTAGDLYQANLIAARLRAVEIHSVLTHDPALAMVAVFAQDSTVRVQVSEPDLERARAELGGQDEDRGSAVPFRSRAWATPMRRTGASSLLMVVGIWVLPILLAALFLLYQFVAP